MNSDQHVHLLHSMVSTMKKSVFYRAISNLKQVLEIRLEGVKLQIFGGKLNVSSQLYMEQVDKYLVSTGVDWKIQEVSGRILAVLGGKLK